MIAYNVLAYEAVQFDRRVAPFMLLCMSYKVLARLY